jgi:DNA binding domain, excisionase family
MGPQGRNLRSKENGPPLMDIEAVAAYLAVNVRHVRRLVSERRIPYLKVGHLVRFDPAEIAIWLDAARRPLVPDTAALHAVRRQRPEGAAVPRALFRRRR